MDHEGDEFFKILAWAVIVAAVRNGGREAVSVREGPNEVV